ncbi:MAG TPA: hypothetical protein VK550_13510 [Polyangiaceae bacterium]|nr:hypothetical protein [Polyangiaceae bacterium]
MTVIPAARIFSWRFGANYFAGIHGAPPRRSDEDAALGLDG